MKLLSSSDVQWTTSTAPTHTRGRYCVLRSRRKQPLHRTLLGCFWPSGLEGAARLLAHPLRALRGLRAAKQLEADENPRRDEAASSHPQRTNLLRRGRGRDMGVSQSPQRSSFVFYHLIVNNNIFFGVYYFTAAPEDLVYEPTRLVFWWFSCCLFLVCLCAVVPSALFCFFMLCSAFFCLKP